MNKANLPEIHSDNDLIALVESIGFLPLLDSGISGFSAEEMADEDCRYVTFDDGGWDWPLWKWKGPVVRETQCYYGKFFNRKAGFIGREWWPDFCNYRRSKYARPEEGSIEEAIVETLEMGGSMITRHLRKACGFDGPKMRSKFDAFLTRLEMATYVVTEDFVYPQDKHGKEYGWGWSLLSTPEMLYGKDCCRCNRTPEESFRRIYEHLAQVLPEATDKQLLKLIG